MDNEANNTLYPITMMTANGQWFAAGIVHATSQVIGLAGADREAGKIEAAKMLAELIGEIQLTAECFGLTVKGL